MIADGYWLPVGDGAADVVFSSNVLDESRIRWGWPRR